MSSPYYLAIDVRADAVTAAVAEVSGAAGVRASSLPLGVEATLPAAVFVAADELLFGDAALERGAAEPERLIRDFLPEEGASAAGVVVSDEHFSFVDLYAWTVDVIVSQVAAERGAGASGVWVVVPDVWSDAHLDAIADALDRDGRSEVDFITVSEALASRWWQLEQDENMPLTAVIADLDDMALTTRIARIWPDGGLRPIGAPIIAPVLVDGSASADLDRVAVESIADALRREQIDLDVVDLISLSGPSPRVDEFEALLIDVFGEPICTVPEPGSAAALGASFALARESRSAVVPVPGTIGALGVSHVVTRSGRASVKWYRRAAPMAALGVAAIVLAGGAAFASMAAFPAATSTGDDPGGLLSSDTERASVSEPNSSATPSSTPSPVASPTPTDPGAIDPPPAPSNPRVPNTTTPRPPVTAPAPPADTAPLPPATDPPAAPAPQVPAPTDPPPVEPTPTQEPEPTPEPTPDPTGEPSPDPEPPAPEPSEPAPPDPTPPAGDVPPALP